VDPDPGGQNTWIRIRNTGFGLSTHLEEELISKIFLVVVTGDEWLDTVPVLGVHPQERTSSAKIKKIYLKNPEHGN
jgi:hypothetical protein